MNGNAPEIECGEGDCLRYGMSAEEIRQWVRAVVGELGLDGRLVNSIERARCAGTLSIGNNVAVARRILEMPGASLSELARAMAGADLNTRCTIGMQSDKGVGMPEAME